ncbi:hypothetical protein G3545_15715 [Starkeya sp. ORNL1]|uniref:hypothetical protein n=1 Tax=Starkeya sp. ORNL1 TaxID=2709380 RepID=UPI00146390C5|nr:hypothetical protein [Starkeya sp. ORNL1]QJP14965.1 hypothetical protein G3545_15715 [Starkeya sp. ORNL1]
MIDNLTERQRQLLAEHERRKATAGPGKPFSRTFLNRMTSSIADPFAAPEAPVVTDDVQPIIFRP